MNRFFLPIPALFLLVFTFGCNREILVKENIGLTQGTTYSVKYHGTERDMQGSIDSLLIEIDKSMSLWLEFSTISRVNKSDTFEKVDPMFMKVLRRSLEINRESRGSFDATVGPLVSAFGFGPEGIQSPDSSIVDSLVKLVGMDQIKVVGRSVQLGKGQKLDFNAIAQGYSVDAVCTLLESAGISNYLVEIGGELRAKGVNGRNKAWIVGIDKPVEDLDLTNRYQVIVSLSDASLATSGNYRKFHTNPETGEKYVHTINPVTGYPIQSELLSATIIARECMDADAYATACMVKGLDNARRWIGRMDGVEAYFVYADEKGVLKEWYTPGLEKLIQ